MIIDVCTYNGEANLWDIHYNVLKDHVDQFFVFEFDTTFSGVPKPYSFQHKYPNVSYQYITKETWEKYLPMAEQSPNTQGAAHWKTEFAQKESIKDFIRAKDDDIVFIGDVDEVWDPEEPILRPSFHVAGSLKLKLRVYTYYLNNSSSEDFYGTIRTTYGYLKGKCLNHLRSNYGFCRMDIDSSASYTEPLGWHFTSMGGPEALEKKLTDSYTQESYATPSVLENLEYNIAKNKDFLGRNFTYTVDESAWPQYLVDHREKYQHLLKPTDSGTTTP